jgi:regulator of sigma E protease
VTTLLAFLFVLGVLVFVHELGHFLAARRIGVRVLTFSLGFGPKILKTKRGDTEYCISAIPLGGYVKMAGESPEDPAAAPLTSSCRRASGSVSRCSSWAP